MFAPRLFGPPWDPSSSAGSDVFLGAAALPAHRMAVELQAVVMAVYGGSRMQDLTSCIPKPLLPVGNKPLLWYPLNMLERAGFEEVIVVTTREVQKYIPDTRLRLDVVYLPEDKAAEMGTADSLRHIYTRIKSDVLVLSCDLITEVALHEVVDLFRAHNATLAMLMKKAPAPAEHVPGQKGKQKTGEEQDFIGVDTSGSRLLLLANEEDLDDGLNLKKSLLQQFPRIKMKMGLLDAHLYCMRKYVLDFLVDNTSFSSLRRELVPYLVSKQFSQSSTEQEMDKRDIHSYIPRDELLEMALTKSSWNDHQGDMKESYHGSRLRCYVHMASNELCCRVNSLAMYMEANKQVPQSSIFSEEPLVQPTADITDKLMVGTDSMIGEQTRIGEKTSVKHSIVGAKCIIRDRVKITNCIIMNDVTIHDGCSLQGSVVCNKAVLQGGADIKDCLLGPDLQINSKEKHVNEIIVGNERLMKI